MRSSAVEHLETRVAGWHPDLPENTAGSLRLDLRDDGRTQHWYLTIDGQEVRVTRSSDDAELVVRADREVFDRLSEGRLHPAAALLRNDLTVQGNLRLLLALRRLFPGPAAAQHPRVVSCGGGGR
ncbi:SCP2 sterol-binding domain-containing protein [Micromonospora yasonensis]|uniref:SCP2 sterol-binding domain-containing protein n=1 Tax=Micromonospora yasonensis TaxID=1128667 RepID=UPI0022304525|nr:SCP2 sterol-binding domain-containing protein [Micromonospora yasonensis]MCW3839055.1 SCP2 sterol-binding domain-containing protein [Micromonospora yasonensis]